MANVVTYLKFRGDISFRRMPFGEADALAFSCLSYLDFTGLLNGQDGIGQVADRYKASRLKKDKNYSFDEKELCLFEMGRSRRYRRVVIANYERQIDEKQEMTYYACTFYRNRHKAIVTFPGTDASLLSWKENFTYLYKTKAPGLERARDYAERALSKRFCKCTFIGHSKGGTLAAYAAKEAPAKLQKRIDAIYLFDAPGFVYNAKENPGFSRVEAKIQSYVPEDSVIGQMFTVPYPAPHIIKATGQGFEQHELLNWQTGPCGLEAGDGLTDFSAHTSSVLNGLLDIVPPDKRKQAIDEMFGILFKNGITRIEEINHLSFGKGIKLVLSYPGLSPETKNMMKTLMREMKNG